MIWIKIRYMELRLLVKMWTGFSVYLLIVSWMVVYKAPLP